MTQSCSVGGSRQAAVLTAIVGFHFGVFLLAAAGFGPRIVDTIRDADPPLIKLLPEQALPLEQSLPDDPRLLAFVVDLLPQPELDIPVFTNEPDTASSYEPGEMAAGEGPGSAVAESVRIAPRLKSQNGRLAALFDSCYPAASRRAGEEGRAVVRLVIGSGGKVSSWRLAEGTGFPRLDDAVRCIIERLEFVPGRQDGRAVEAAAQLPVVFRLHRGG